MKHNKNPRATRPLFAAAAATCIAFAMGNAAADEPFRLSAPGFADGATLDSSHAAPASVQGCGPGDNVSPALEWRNAPAGTKSFAVSMFDPAGAKGMGVVHWLQYGIPPSVTSIAAGAPAPVGSVGGINRSGHDGYFGMCTPIGDAPHPYVIQAYALDLAPGDLPAGLTRDALLAAIKGHVLNATAIVLRYSR